MPGKRANSWKLWLLPLAVLGTVVLACWFVWLIFLDSLLGNRSNSLERRDSRASSLHLTTNLKIRGNLRQLELNCLRHNISTKLFIPASLSISLHLIGKGDDLAFEELVSSMKNACYHTIESAFDVDLHIWQHGQRLGNWTHDTVDWEYGETHTHEDPITGYRGDGGGRGGVGFTDLPTINEVRIVLLEGTVVSPLYFLWVMSVLARYLGSEVTTSQYQEFIDNVFVISLANPHLHKVYSPPKNWEAKDHPILHTAPSSYGGAYCGWHWGLFTKFAQIQAASAQLGKISDPSLGRIQDVALQLLSQGRMAWGSALEHVMVDFLFGKGLATLSPNLDGGESFVRPLGSDTLLVQNFKSSLPPQVALSSLAAFDLNFEKHPDFSHLIVLGHRFLAKLKTLEGNKSKEANLHSVWSRQPEIDPPYQDLRYLVYQPQFGMGNQLDALKAGLAVARVLKRTLVIPHFFSDNAHGDLIGMENIIDFQLLELIAGRHWVILQSKFEELLGQGTVSLPDRVHEVSMTVVQLNASNAYLEHIGWDALPKVHLDISEKTDVGWSAVLGDCEDRVIILSALFGMFNKWSTAAAVDDIAWHKRVAQHVVQEAQWVSDIADMAVDSLSKVTSISEHDGEFGKADNFICVHVRRGDFLESCHRYEQEIATGHARGWVKANFKKGELCWVQEVNFKENLELLMQEMSNRSVSHIGPNFIPRFIYMSSDDDEFSSLVNKHSPLRLFTIKDVLGLGPGAHAHRIADRAVSRKVLQAGLPMLDASICSRGRVLVLNRFSTYSALIASKAKVLPGFLDVYYWSKSASQQGDEAIVPRPKKSKRVRRLKLPRRPQRKNRAYRHIGAEWKKKVRFRPQK